MGQSYVSSIPSLTDLQGLDIYVDGADLADIEEASRISLFKGFTTNPSLMLKCGIDNYPRFIQRVLELTDGRPTSFEVLSEEPREIVLQARRISGYGQNVQVKVPVVSSFGESLVSVIRELCLEGIACNVTAVFTNYQIHELVDSLPAESHFIVSIFVGRISDTGRDPLPLLAPDIRSVREKRPNWQLLWASPRELLNVFQAHAAGFHIITCTKDIRSKFKIVGKDLKDYSIETSRGFISDSYNLLNDNSNFWSK
jgi:transaldolase